MSERRIWALMLIGCVLFWIVLVVLAVEAAA